MAIKIEPVLRRVRDPGPPQEGRAAGPALSIMGTPTIVRASSSRQPKNPAAELKARAAAGAVKLPMAPIDPQRELLQEDAAAVLALLERAGEVAGSEADDAAARTTAVIISARPEGDEDQEPGAHGEFGLAPDSAEEAQALASCQKAPLLQDMGKETLQTALRSGALRPVRSGRDKILDLPGQILLLLEGQAALAEFAPGILSRERAAQAALRAGDRQAEKQEYVRRQAVGPLMRLAESDIASFGPGEVIDLGAVPRPAKATAVPAVFSLTPLRGLAISRTWLSAQGAENAAFRERARRARDMLVGRIQASTEERRTLADFQIRQGVAVATTLRVRDLDKCIECYACERACEERYGAQRFWLSGKILGVVDFVSACRTCVDQRCIDPCGYDAIRYDAERQEVVINEERCTGCTMCARACPYDAIQMCDLEEHPRLRERLQREDKLGFGADQPRRLQLRQIANKCDHCVGYEDQGCISACPTGALLEVPPQAAFLSRTTSMVDAAAGGFAESVAVDSDKLLRRTAFLEGLADRAPEKRLKGEGGALRWLWLLSLIALLFCAIEILLRARAPRLSAQFLGMVHRQGLEPEIALLNIKYYPGDLLSVWLGRVGALLLASTVVYSWGRTRKDAGSALRSFDLHVFGGTMGALFTILHSGFRLNPPLLASSPSSAATLVSLSAFWLMVACALSGLVGRFLSTQISAQQGQAGLLRRELSERLRLLRNQHAGVLEADRYFDQVFQGYAAAGGSGGGRLRAALLAVSLQFHEALRQPFRATRLRRRLTGIKDPSARSEVARLITELLRLHRKEALLPIIAPLFGWWRAIHVPAAVALGVFALMHILLMEFGSRLGG